MKNIRIVHGTLMHSLEVGSRALIFEEGRYFAARRSPSPPKS